MEKRGIAVSFKWIFALIAGMIIFLFIINFAYKHIFISESKTSTILLTNIEAQLDSISFADDFDTILDLNEKFKINLNCNSLQIANIPLKTNKIIFSPKTIESNNLKIWTRTWNYPFTITNFYYITNKDYYFIDPPYELLSQIPESFNIKTYPDTAEEDAEIVFFTKPAQYELEKYKEHKIKIINNNKVTFQSKSADYFGDEMLLGAIFTDDIAKYNCLKQRALNKLKIIASVYQKKAQTLSQINCQDKYQLIITLLENFKIELNPEAVQNADLNLQENDCTPLFN